MAKQNIVIKAFGLIFILSASLKALDFTAFAVQVSFYGIVREPLLVRTIAAGLIGLEAALGIALIVNLALRRVTLPAMLVMLIGFTGLLAWAWAFRDIKNCGCFGRFLPMGPGESMLKNMVMIALALWAWRTPAHRGHEEPDPDLPQKEIRELFQTPVLLQKRWSIARPGKIGLAALMITFTMSLIGLAAVRSMRSTPKPIPVNEHRARIKDPSPPTCARQAKPAESLINYKMSWQGREIDLARGTCFVGMLSDSCVHCAEDVAKLNRLMERPGFPPVVGLMLGEEDSLQNFQAAYKPKFPLMLIPVLEFLNLIGDAPPRFMLVMDGRQIKFWDDKLPDESAVMQVLNQR